MNITTIELLPEDLDLINKCEAARAAWIEHCGGQEGDCVMSVAELLEAYQIAACNASSAVMLAVKHRFGV